MQPPAGDALPEIRRPIRKPLRLRHLLTDRAVNTLLLVTLLALALTGIISLFVNADGQRVVFVLHRIGGAALLVLLAPKAGIIARSLRRRVGGGPDARGGRRLAVSLLLLGLTAAVIAAALGWSLARGPWRGEWGLPLIVVHWYLGLALLPLAALHARQHWRRPRRADFAARRRVLALGASALLGAALWRGLGAGAAATEAEQGRRRFTGSREADYGTPNGFFVTQFLNDDPAPLDVAAWRLRVTGRVGRPLSLDYAAIGGAARVVATVDCTGGVYATREWRGVGVGAVLDAAQVSPRATIVWFVSTTGYRWPLPLAEARRALLATQVGGEPLSHAHGAPLRLVAPERRGFQWIKWLDRLEVS